MCTNSYNVYKLCILPKKYNWISYDFLNIQR